MHVFSLIVPLLSLPQVRYEKLDALAIIKVPNVLWGS